MSPFLALYGYHPPFITSPLKGNIKVQSMEHHIGDQQEVLKILKEKLVTTQNRMKHKKINITMKGNLKWGIGYF
jgi:hypothetical protein